MKDYENHTERVWAWLEAATEFLADNFEAARLRQELWAHFQETYEAFITAGQSPNEAAAASLERLGDASEIVRVWHQRMGDRVVLIWTLWGIAAILQGIALAGWVYAWPLSWGTALIVIGLQWRTIRHSLGALASYWLGQCAKISTGTVLAGCGFGLVGGLEPLWAGQWLDYAWNPWKLPFILLFLVCTVMTTWRLAHRPGHSPAAAAGQASIALIGGFVMGAVLGIGVVFEIYLHGAFPLRAVVPNWPWGALEQWVKTKLLVGGVAYVTLVLATSAYTAGRTSRKLNPIRNK